MNQDAYNEFLEVQDHADCLFEPDGVAFAISQVAAAVTAELAERNPLVLCVMTGGLRFCSDLIGHFEFPLQLDYLNVSRYRDGRSAGQLDWLHEPAASLRGRDVLVADDILDQGVTLAAVRDWCVERGAATVATAVLVSKRIAGRAIEADYVALMAPDRYLFGEGMDFKGYGRNLRGIYALPDDR